MMQDIMDSEKSYDSLPNFTAADCLRLLGNDFFILFIIMYLGKYRSDSQRICKKGQILVLQGQETAIFPIFAILWT